MYFTLLKRELSLYLKGVGDLLAVPSLYLLAIGFYMLGQPFGTGPGQHEAVAALWLTALLSLALTQYRIWEQDAQDGTLEQAALLPVALEGLVAVKLFAHWLMTGVPLVVLTPFMAHLLGVEVEHLWPLALGTFALTCLGSVAGAVSLRFSSRQLLTLLLIFPLAVPALIFGAAASAPEEGGGGGQLLVAYVLAVCPLAVAATTLLLRIAIRG